MQSSTTPAVCQPGAVAVALSSALDDAAELRSFLPADLDLEGTARTMRALCRRREVRNAFDLLRLCLAYAVCEGSLRDVSAWFGLRALGRLSKTAVRKRLRHSVRWLGHLLLTWLHIPTGDMEGMRGVRVRLVDATVVSRPGSRGTDWRVHLSLDLGRVCLDGIEVTDAHGAETLARFPVQPGEIRLADRGYAHARGLGPVLQADGQVVVRMNWQNLRLETQEGERVHVAAWLRELARSSDTSPQEQTVWLPTPQGRFALRLIAQPLAPEQAEAARNRARQRAKHKRHTVDPRTLLAAGFVLLLTNLPAEPWPAPRVLALYRLRWQIEIHIKRLKSLLGLDNLRAKDTELAQAYLLSKLLGALLVEGLIRQVRKAQPQWWTAAQQPVNLGRLFRLAWLMLVRAVAGTLTRSLLLARLPDLRRSLCDEPRRRHPQWLLGQSCLHGESGC